MHLCWKTAKKKWAAAENFCVKEGGHLASVLTLATKHYVEKRVRRSGLSKVWLGGNDIEQEGFWKWTSGEVWKKGLNIWTSPPNNWNGNQDCLQYHNDRWKWDDTDCAKYRAFICSKNICKRKIIPL